MANLSVCMYVWWNLYFSELKRKDEAVWEGSLTLWKLWRVVIDVSEGDVDSSGSRQSSDRARHVFGLNHHSIVVPGLTVHVGHRCTDDTWGWDEEKVLEQTQLSYMWKRLCSYSRWTTKDLLMMTTLCAQSISLFSLQLEYASSGLIHS